MMKRTKQSILLLPILVCFMQLGLAQDFARAQPTTRTTRRSSATVASKSLKDVLGQMKEHYRVDILYFDRVVSGYTVLDNVVQLNLGIEQNLNTVLKPIGLDFKKTKSGGYVILEKETERRTGEKSPKFPETTPLSKEGANKEANEKLSPVHSTASETNRTTRKEMAVTVQEEAPLFTVTGRVTDEKGEPIVGAAVQVKGTNIGAITDENGKFSLQTVDGKATLMVSFIGYEKQEVAVNGRTQVDIRLSDDTKKLDEVVVVGFGTQKKINATGAISSMGTKELIQSPVANISNSLVGRLTGLFATQSGGEPGNDASKIRIRGIGTFSGNTDPLTLVDGIQVDN